MFIFFLFRSLTPYDDNRAEIRAYSDIFMLFTLQHLTEQNDSKEIVDKAYKTTINDTVGNFNVFFEDLIKKKLLSNASTFLFRPESVNIENRCSFYILHDLMQRAFSGVKNAKMQDKEVIQKKTFHFIEKNFYHQTEIFRDMPLDIPQTDLNVQSPKLKAMLIAIIKIWPLLYKEVIDKEFTRNSTILMTKNPFTIPGGRFREIYYWDSYWIFDGQLVLGMDNTVLKGLENFVSLIETYGFIPNGTRLYYTKRSQPPYFIQMVYNFYNHASEPFRKMVLAPRYIDAMVKEYRFWMEKRKKRLHYEGNVFDMNYYSVTTDYPRPEALTEDIKTVKEYLKRVKKYQIHTEKMETIYQNCVSNGKNPFEYESDENNIYGHIKSAAESGWDFSTRFFKNNTNMYTICTREIIPVDLNAILYSNEVILSELLKLGQDYRSKEFKDAYEQRKILINKLFWKDGTWRDYNYIEGKHTNNEFYFSNIMPMIYGIDPPDGNAYDIMYKYRKELFGYKGGIPASGRKGSSQQWDFPNVWAPHQHLFVMYLLKINERKMANHVAASFYRSVQSCNSKGNFIFYEKYKCDELGKPGDMGEYKVQDGFGWTNGVITRFIEIFKDNIIVNEFEHEEDYDAIVKILKEKSEKRIPSNENKENEH